VNPLDWHQIALPVAVCLALAVLAVRMARYRFVMLGLGAIVGYAMLQDQVSARLCPEYFTILHPPIPGVTDPTVLGIGWGFLGAWWGGVLLGFALALAATRGSRPALAPRAVVRPLGVLVIAVATVTALTGFTVWHHAQILGLALDDSMTRLVPQERHRALFTVACYHLTAYISASIGGVLVCIWAWNARKARPQDSPTG